MIWICRWFLYVFFAWIVAMPAVLSMQPMGPEEGRAKLEQRHKELEELEKKYGKDDSRVADFICRFACLAMYAPDEFQERDQLVRRALDIYEKAGWPKDTSNYIDGGVTNLIADYCKRKRYSDADAMVNRVSAMKSRAGLRTTYESQQQAMLLFRQGKYTQAQDIYKRLLSQTTEKFQKVEYLLPLAALYYAQDDLPKAREVYEQAHKEAGEWYRQGVEFDSQKIIESWNDGMAGVI